MVDTSVKVKLRAKTPGGNAEVCEFQGDQGAAASPGSPQLQQRRQSAAHVLERAYNFRSAQEICSQSLQCCSAFFILNRKPDFASHLFKIHLSSRLEIGQFNNVKTRAGANLAG
jgi:hypothetical protein